MEAGRELDRLIAEKVMGFSRDNENPRIFRREHERYVLEMLPEDGGGWNSCNGPDLMPRYSTDILAAFEVVEKVTSEKWIAVEIVCRPKKADAGTAWTDGNKYCAVCIYGGQGAYPSVRHYSTSAAHAICKAILELFKPL